MSTQGKKRVSLTWRTLLSLVLVLVTLAGTGIGFGLLAALKEPAAKRPQVDRVYNVGVFQTERADLRRLISAFGTVQADVEVTVSAQVSGEIVATHPELHVGQAVAGPRFRLPAYGDEWPASGLQLLPFPAGIDLAFAAVQLGELLVRVDPRVYRERVVQARNRLVENDTELKRLHQEEMNNARLLAKVEADYKTYQREYERLLQLRERNAVTPAQLANAEIELRRFEVAYLQRLDERELFPVRREQLLDRRRGYRAELQIAELELAHTEVRSPLTGRLSEVLVEEGQFVRVGDPLVRVVDVRRVEVPLAITLSDYADLSARLRNQETVRVALADDTTTEPLWFGEIERTSPVVDEQTRTVQVFAVVDNDAEENRAAPPLLPGTFVHARIEGALIPEALVVPRDTIVEDHVFVIDEQNRVRQRTVDVIRPLHSLAWLDPRSSDSAWTGRERVVLTNLDVMHDGAAVKVQSVQTLDDELDRQRVTVLKRFNPNAE